MRWGKIVLIFQAVITLIIGIIFFLQFAIDVQSDVSNLTINIMNTTNFTSGPSLFFIEVKHRYTVAAYILSIISIIELLIIFRLTG